MNEMNNTFCGHDAGKYAVGHDNVVIGDGSDPLEFSRVTLIGDNLTATKDGDIQISSVLFGRHRLDAGEFLILVE